MRKFRSVIGRMDFLFWFVGGETKAFARPLQRLSVAVRTLCEIDGSIQRGKAFSLEASGLRNLRKRWRRDVRQMLLPKNQKTISLKIAALIQSLRAGAALRSRAKVAELRAELSRWRKKDITPRRDLSRLVTSVERARYLLEARDKSADKLRALLKVLHKTGELRTLSLCHPAEESIKQSHHESLKEVGSTLEPALRSARKKLKGF